jgi:hypothetical protein
MNGIPQQKPGKIHTHKGICSLAEHKQPALAVVRCPTKGKKSSDAPTTSPQQDHQQNTTRRPKKLASIFDTLLSSQGSDAHRRLAHASASSGLVVRVAPACGGATVLTYPRPCLGVKSTAAQERPDRSRLDLGGTHTLAPSRLPAPHPVSAPLAWPCSGSGVGVHPGDRPAWCGICIPPLGVRSSLAG